MDGNLVAVEVGDQQLYWVRPNRRRRWRLEDGAGNVYGEVRDVGPATSSEFECYSPDGVVMGRYDALAVAQGCVEQAWAGWPGDA